MIIPTIQDAILLASLRDNPINVSVFNDVASNLCRQRGERPVLVRWAISVRRAIFHPVQWMIVMPRMVALDFLHEVAHMLSVIDLGRNGSEEDAEIFAHGVCSWLWPEQYGMNNHKIRWYLSSHHIMRRVLWTSNYLHHLTMEPCHHGS